MNHLSPMDHNLSNKLNEIIYTNLENENFGVKELVQETGMSRSNLNRKLHFICGKTINQYIREVRLERARDMLKQGFLTASEVAFKVGYSSPSYFSTCFSEHFGFPPGEIKRRSLNGTEVNDEELSSTLVNVPRESKTAKTKLLWRKKQFSVAVIYVSVFTVLLVVILYSFNRSSSQNSIILAENELKKQARSIAVLPFINDSQDQENVYFINGIMEAILDNLSKIKDLEVRPRTSVEQYRNNKTKSIQQIARELGLIISSKVVDRKWATR